MSNQTLDKIKIIQEELNELEAKKDLPQAQRVIASVVKLLDDSVSVEDQDLFQLFTDSDGKIRSNASWFYEDSVMTDRKATYKIHPNNNLNIDIKLYGVTKPTKRTIAWAQSLTPNFEDEPFNKSFNVGIDFIVPKNADRIIIVLSKNWVIRTLELKGELTATYQEILSKWDQIKDFSKKEEVHNILWESFDIHPLNKKFYTGISERFTLLRQHLVKEEVFDEKHASLFANRLIGRIIFTWFLDKKGIINPEAGYFDSESFDNDNEYYKERLERLFFGILNTPIGDREYKDDQTPFLNGGLFEARENDLYKSSKLNFPKNYFDELFKFLSSYNFTTDESTSQFQQVAIDPEMLGRIFENLLAEMTEDTGEQARKAKGTFYTPREIVDYMCRESLRGYLKTKIEPDENLDQRLYQLIDAPDKDFQDQDHNWRRDWKPYKEGIITALDELKVLDPACGSGAFPIGMLQLLVRVYERLEARFSPYKTKLGIIEKNIYGVDIEPMAVEIARLRAWLSIIVDEESDSKKIKPLPNLEFKFICANSLISLDNSGSIAIGEDSNFQEKLTDIRDQYFNTESLNKKKKLKIDYDQLVNTQQGLFGESKKSKQLKTYKPFDNEAQAEFFDPEFMFGVTLFDVFIGNPPYGAKYPKEHKFYFKDNYESARTIKGKQKGSLDTFTLFIERGISLLGKNSFLNYIVPISITSSDSVTGIHNLLKRECEYIKMASFSVRPKPVFENAMVNTSIILCKKSNKKECKVSMTKMYRRDFSTTLDQVISKIKFIEVDGLKLRGRYPKISEDIEKRILKKLLAINTKVYDYIDSKNGKSIYYRMAGGRYFKIITNYPTGSSAEKEIKFKSDFADSIGCILSSNLYFWFYQIFSDNLNQKAYEIQSFPIPKKLLSNNTNNKLKKIYERYLSDVESNSLIRKTENYSNINSFKEYKISKSKETIDEIDDLIYKFYELTDEEIEYVKNYEAQFRLAD